MKTFWKFLCATALVISFAACTEKDGENDTPADSDLAAKIIGSWQVDRMTLGGTSVDPSQYDLKATITFNADGRGTVKTDRNHYDANYTIHGTTVEIHLPDGTMPLKVDNITNDEMTVTTENIPWIRIQASATLHLKRVSNGGNNGGDNGGNGSTEGGTSFDGTVSITIGTPSWERYNNNAYFAIFQWSIKTNSNNVRLSSFFDEHHGKTYSFGIGYFPVGAEGDNLPQYFNGDKEVNSHVITYSNDDSTEIKIISKIVIDNRKQARAYVYLSDGQFHYSNPFIIDPSDNNQGGNGGNGDVKFGVSMPEFVSNTATSITLSSQITGNVTSPDEFTNARCGFVWVPESQGRPTMRGNNIIDCTQSAWQNQGQSFQGTIENLTPNTKYNIAAFIQMSADSDPIIGDHKTLQTASTNGGGTGEGGGHHGNTDTNWITVNHVMPYSETSVEISINAYFDSGNPIAIGACYNTTGNPTINDNVYNGFDHITDIETRQWDETIIDLFPNNDGSRTVKFLITNLQPNTTYYFRVFMQWASDDIHPIIYTNAGSTTTGRAK